jgi:HIRAN domain-containing protein
MTDPALRRIPMVAGLAYIERVRRLPSQLAVTLQPERENRYFLHAIAVLAGGEKVGYVAPEIARRYHAPMLAHPAALTCPARRASISDHQTSGVELILDFSELPVTPEP